MKKIRTVVVGLGRIAWSSHLPCLVKHHGFEVVAVVDPLAERRKEAIELFQVPRAYGDLAEALAGETPELTVIASPTCFHQRQTLEALNAGSNVFCDKPAVLKSDELTPIFALAQEKQLLYSVFQPWRMMQEPSFVTQIVRSGRLGKVNLIKYRRNEYAVRTDWQAYLRNGGGMLLNYGSHLVDHANALFDCAPRVLGCTADRIISAGDADDCVKMLLRYGDVTVDIEINQAAADTLTDFEIYGSNGSAVHLLHEKRWRIRTRSNPAVLQDAASTDLAAADRKYPAAKEAFDTAETVAPEVVPAINLYYENLYAALTMGAELLNPPSWTRRLVQTIDLARQKALEC